MYESIYVCTNILKFLFQMLCFYHYTSIRYKLVKQCFRENLNFMYYL